MLTNDHRRGVVNLKKSRNKIKLYLPWNLRISDGSRNFLRRLRKEKENL